MLKISTNPTAFKESWEALGVKSSGWLLKTTDNLGS